MKVEMYKIVGDKPVYKSSTVWAAVALIIYAAYKYLNHEPLKEEDIYALLAIFGIMATGFRRAIGNLITVINKLLYNDKDEYKL